ncbi:MAG: hypothetical protein BIFFINMI_03066 [Phycisphaerae bacterium]|nr:hypothetical protein [Phycisphaerae bacterium]
MADRDPAHPPRVLTGQVRMACLCLAAALLAPVWRAARADDASPMDLLRLPPATQPDAPTTRAADDDSPPLVSGPVVRVGVLLPLTGDLAPYARSARLALELSADAANRRHGLSGPRIELVVYDTHGSDRDARESAIRAILVDGVDALLGGLTGPEGVALRSIAERRRVPLVVLSGGYDSVAENARTVLRVGLSDAQLADALADFAWADLKARRHFLVMASGADRPGTVGEEFNARMKDAGSALAGVAFLGAKTDPADLAAQVAEAKPDVIMADVAQDRLVALTAALRQAKLTAPVLDSVRFWDLSALMATRAEGLGPLYLAVEFLPQPDSRACRALAADFGKAAGREPDAVAATAYDAMMLLAEGARRRAAAGGKLVDRMLEIRSLPGLLGPIGFDDDGVARRPAAIAQWVDQAADAGARLRPVRLVWPGGASPTTQPDKGTATK